MEATRGNVYAPAWGSLVVMMMMMMMYYTAFNISFQWMYQDKNRLRTSFSPLLLHKSGIIYLLLSEAHHHLTHSNVTSKLTRPTLSRHNAHHLSTPRTSESIFKTFVRYKFCSHYITFGFKFLQVVNLR